MTVTATHPALTMDAEHRYRIGDVEIPSVTQVINSVMPGWQSDEWYMQRGSAMHHGCRLMDEGKLDWSSVAPEIAGRLRAWEKFRATFPAQVFLCECPMVHRLYRYAGTLDRVLIDDKNRSLVIVDIKSSITPQVAVQLGAYRMMHDDSGIDLRMIGRGVAVELADDGTFKTKWFTRKELLEGGRIFLACLTVHNFRQRENLK